MEISVTMRTQATQVQMLLPRDAGLSLIETLIVLVIIGLVSAMIVPKVIGRPDEARITVARNDISAIASALKMYRLDNRAYPSTAQGLSALVERPSGSPQPANWHPEGYLDEAPKDPWGNFYEYRSPGEKGGFDLLSFGADGKLGGEGQDADILIQDGAR
jgi:general secretion pathway protein G|tara:strand:+ start:252735 stop:253214 length:480 start_codon:yes stop_codon:yes gene_type:complete